MDEIEQNNEELREEEIQPSSGPIEDILPTTNEDEMKKLMQELDREQVTANTNAGDSTSR